MKRKNMTPQQLLNKSGVRDRAYTPAMTDSEAWGTTSQTEFSARGKACTEADLPMAVG